MSDVQSSLSAGSFLSRCCVQNSLRAAVDKGKENVVQTKMLDRVVWPNP